MTPLEITLIVVLAAIVGFFLGYQTGKPDDGWDFSDL